MSMIITAKDNDKIKYTKSLLKSKNRNKESKFIIEGYRILTLAIECRAKLDYVFINEDFEKKQEHKEFLETLKKKDIRVYKTTNKIFEDLTDTENTQGIIGVVKFKQRTLEKNLTDDNRFVLILDRIQDPGNMGTIIRTADAAGVDAIIALKGCVIHATQEEALRILKLKKFDIVSSYLDTNNYYNTVEYNYKTALVIGNEANGINEELVSKSDVLVKIPIYGKAESLNAAISSAILMYEIKKYLV